MITYVLTRTLVMGCVPSLKNMSVEVYQITAQFVRPFSDV